MQRIFVYEFLSGGPVDAAPGDPALAELLPQGVAMRDAIVADLAALPDLEIACAVGADPAAALRVPPRLAEGTRVTAVRSRNGESARDFLQREARVHDVCWVVAPETGGLLASLQAVVPPAAWLGCDAAALALASSKSATLAALAQRGVLTPLALASGADSGQRWVAKPDDGAGGLDTRVFADRAAAEAFAQTHQASGQPMTVEAHVPGEALSITLLAGEGWVQALGFNRQRIAESPKGEIAYGGVDVHALGAAGDPRLVRLHLLVLEVARAVPGLLGIVGIDLVWHAERGPVVIEVNPRVTSAYVGLSAALGRNLGADALRALATAVSRHG